MKRCLLTLLCTLALGSIPEHVSSASLTRINPELATLDAKTQSLHRQMLRHNAQRDLESAIESARLIIQRIEDQQGNPMEAYLNLGLLQAAAGDAASAVQALDNSIVAGETHLGPDTQELIRPLTVQGLLLRLTGNLEDSTTVLRKAQHLVHRAFGVYSTRQQSILDQLTLIQLQSRDLDGAIQQQTFSYKTHVSEHGEDSAKLLPQTRRYAMFLASLGKFRPAVESLEEAIENFEQPERVEDQSVLIDLLQSLAQIRLIERELVIFNSAVPDFGADTQWLSAVFGERYYLTPPVKAPSGQSVELRVTPPPDFRISDEPSSYASLQSPPQGRPQPLNDQVIRLDQSTPYSVSVGITDSESRQPNRIMPYMRSAVSALKRVVEILDADPRGDLVDKIAARIALGDIYAISGSAKAASTYRDAWQLMQQSSDPDRLQVHFFGQPNRVQPRKMVPLPLTNKRASGEYEVRFIFDVGPDGKVVNIKVLESNIPDDEIRSLKQKLYAFQYRPQMRQGNFVTSKDVTLTQTFYGDL